MALVVLRSAAGASVALSGALLAAASWQRWAAACPWSGDADARACTVRQDHLYDFLPPTKPWEPAGAAAQLGGLSLLVLALATYPLAWALAGRRPGPVALLAAATSALATGSIGLGTLLSGLRGHVVEPVALGMSLFGWVLVQAAVLAWLVVVARGWARLSAVLLLLASPLVAFFTYAIGPYDAAPWWEAVSGLLLVGGGGCLLVAARRSPAQSAAAVRTRPATPADVL